MISEIDGLVIDPGNGSRWIFDIRFGMDEGGPYVHGWIYDDSVPGLERSGDGGPLSCLLKVEEAEDD